MILLIKIQIQIKYYMKIDTVYRIHFDELSNRKNYLDSEIPNRYGFSNYEYIISTRETDKKILDTTKYKYDKTKWTSQLSNSEILLFSISTSPECLIIVCFLPLTVLLTTEKLVFPEKRTSSLSEGTHLKSDDIFIIYLAFL